MHELKETTNPERLWSRRWKVTLRTVQNWIKKGEAVGAAPPFDAEDPADLIEWYRDVFGKAPKGDVEARAKELRIEAGLEAVQEVTIDLGPIEVIQKALERVGMSLSYARIVEEEERAAALYWQLRKDGASTVEARRIWKEASEMKRAAQKGEDAVLVARELLREWVLKEWEPMEREKRKLISGEVLGRKAREALRETNTEKEWERVWDRELEKVLAGK